MVNKFYYLCGGTERYYFDMTRLLQQRGHEVIPFAMTHPHNFESEYASYFVDEISFERSANLRRPLSSFKAALRAIYSKQAEWKLHNLIRIKKPDIAYLHNIHHQLSLSILSVLKQHNIPIIWRLHDYSLLCPNSLFYTHGAICEACAGGRFYQIAWRGCRRGSRAASIVAGLSSYLDRWLGLANLADLFMAPSSFLATKMVEHGLDAKKIVVIPNFIDLSTFEPDLSTSSPIATEESKLVYFGRLSSEKGLKILIQAVARVPDSHLTIVGDGPQREELETLAGRIAQGQVEFAGHQATTPLLTTLRRARLVILPSEWYENCPYSILEAFAMAKAVIASNIGGIPELIDNGKDGLLFKPGSTEELADRIGLILHDAPRLQELGANARRKVHQKYDPDSHYSQFIEVCSNLGIRI